MNSDNQQTSNDSGTPFPLPGQPAPSPQGEQKPDIENPAANLIRQKLETLYGKEPDAAVEALDLTELGSAGGQSRHQRFMKDLINSGKSLADVQTEWHEYYAGLPDKDKHTVWQEFYETHAQASQYARIVPAAAPKAENASETMLSTPRPGSSTRKRGKHLRTLVELRNNVVAPASGRRKLTGLQHFQSVLFGLGVGSLMIIVFLFSFFNERFIAPLITPSKTITSTPIISDSATTVGSDPKIIIPKINVEIPVVYGEKSAAEAAIQKALESGVVHYPNTALPGEDGNVVIFGHSSNNIFNRGKYKFAFVLLSRMENGDTFYLQKNKKRYTYEVYKKEIVKPTDFSVLGDNTNPATATLITCDPPGTSINRLVVIGRQINPDPSSNLATKKTKILQPEAKILPGNAPSLWSRLFSWL